MKTFKLNILSFKSHGNDFVIFILLHHLNRQKIIYNTSFLNINSTKRFTKQVYILHGEGTPKKVFLIINVKKRKIELK